MDVGHRMPPRLLRRRVHTCHELRRQVPVRGADGLLETASPRRHLPPHRLQNATNDAAVAQTHGVLHVTFLVRQSHTEFRVPRLCQIEMGPSGGDCSRLPATPPLQDSPPGRLDGHGPQACQHLHHLGDQRTQILHVPRQHHRWCKPGSSPGRHQLVIKRRMATQSPPGLPWNPPPR